MLQFSILRNYIKKERRNAIDFSIIEIISCASGHNCLVVRLVKEDENSKKKFYIHVMCSSQKQPSVLKKWCSENMQQIYSRTPLPKFDFNKVAIEIALRHGCSPVHLLHIFLKNTSGQLLLSSRHYITFRWVYIFIGDYVNPKSWPSHTKLAIIHNMSSRLAVMK